ncbi:MAG: biotin-dependent carboxyltransferase family protein [Desulfovermiculus sp.]
MPETLLVLDPGSLTTVQDLGRFGWQSLGVPLSGALDPYAVRAGNLLVGNPQNAAVLEMTVTGVTLAVMHPACLAVTGAKATIKVNTQSKPPWQSFAVQPGDVLRIGQVVQGCRIYLAASGGIDVPVIMGSRSTSVDSGLGGFFGRPLHKGDMISISPLTAFPGPRAVPPSFVPQMPPEISLRCLPGPQEDFFDHLQSTLLKSRYTVSARADRRGVRLDGPALEHVLDSPGRVLSEPCLPGNIQIPGDGQPIVLFVEQTVGGYAKAATVISSDLRRLAQAVPGTGVSLQAVSLQKAHQVLTESRSRIRALEKELL